MNVLDTEVKDGVARICELQFPATGQPDGTRLRIGFRPYAVQISADLNLFPYRAVLRRTFFLGIMLRLELELPSGLILRSRMTKEEYAQLGAGGWPGSFISNPQLSRAECFLNARPHLCPLPRGEDFTNHNFWFCG